MKDSDHIIIDISGHSVNVKVASTKESRIKGFTGMKEPIGNNGILFVYKNEDNLRFWMKNIRFPLDIIFFDSNFDEVDRQTMQEWKGENDGQLKIYMSKKPAKYAIELPYGWCKTLKTKSKLKI